MKTATYALGFLLLTTNLFWFGVTRNLEHLYSKLDADYEQEAGLRDEADSILRLQPRNDVYRITKNAAGEALITCLNGGDATVRPVPEFGSIVVSCGK